MASCFFQIRFSFGKFRSNHASNTEVRFDNNSTDSAVSSYYLSEEGGHATNQEDGLELRDSVHGNMQTGDYPTEN